MRKSWLVGASVLTLAATALLLLPSVSLAQRRGGWGRGGWGGGYDGWGRGYGYGGYNDGFGYGRSYGSPYYGGYGYNRGWYSPGVYNYDYAPSYGYDFGESVPPAGETYYGGGAYATDQSNMNQQQMPQEAPNKALVVLRVPSNAQVFFEGQPTTSQGTVRAYLSPPIDPSKEYSYHVKAQWNQNGRPVTQERQIRVHAGRQARFDFMQAGQPSYGAGPGMENEEFAPAPREGNLPPSDRDLRDRRGVTGDEGVIPGPGAKTRDQTNTRDQSNLPGTTPSTNDRNRSSTNPSPTDNQKQNKSPNPNPSNP
jgi:uncharacterized protein (TIGR03000 family)